MQKCIYYVVILQVVIFRKFLQPIRPIKFFIKQSGIIHHPKSREKKVIKKKNRIIITGMSQLVHPDNEGAIIDFIARLNFSPDRSPNDLESRDEECVKRVIKKLQKRKRPLVYIYIYVK